MVQQWGQRDSGFPARRYCDGLHHFNWMNSRVSRSVERQMESTLDQLSWQEAKVTINDRRDFPDTNTANRPMTLPEIADYQWLVGDEGLAWLEKLRDARQPSVGQVKSLRRTLNARRTHLLLEQVELRVRARDKFPQANRMFFTRKALEQATDGPIALYKAARFPRHVPLADLCSGIGGDLLAIAPRGPTTAVDHDPVLKVLAEANCRAFGVPLERFETCDVRSLPLGRFAAWHIDPDRRATGGRTTRVMDAEPPLEVLAGLLEECGQAAFKLAPASEVPMAWQQHGERQWIGSRRECRQQVLWFGQLAEHPGLHTATMLDSHGLPSRTLVGEPSRTIEIADRLGRYLYEPAPVVRAAHLTAALAMQAGLGAIAVGQDFLTGDRLVHDGLLSVFEVEEVLPFDLRKLRGMLRRRDVGQVEVKKRGVDVDPASLQKRLSSAGQRAATLLLIRCEDVVQAILAQRMTE